MRALTCVLVIIVNKKIIFHCFKIITSIIIFVHIIILIIALKVLKWTTKRQNIGKSDI